MLRGLNYEVILGYHRLEKDVFLYHRIHIAYASSRDTRIIGFEVVSSHALKFELPSLIANGAIFP